MRYGFSINSGCPYVTSKGIYLAFFVRHQVMSKKLRRILELGFLDSCPTKAQQASSYLETELTWLLNVTKLYNMSIYI